MTMRIELKEFAEWKENVDSKSLPHFSSKNKETYFLYAVDGDVTFFLNLPIDDVPEYETNYLPNSNRKRGNFYQREPFAAKVLETGEQLFRRKHGQTHTIPGNTEQDIIFVVPYGRAKINKLEIIDANALDAVDLLVKSPTDANLAAAYGMPPDYLLNQFGFDAVVSSLLYSDKSDYDAEVFQGMQIICKYKNKTPNSKMVGFNLIFHELVSP